MTYRFKITVDGTGIREYYEFEEYKTEREAKAAWLADAEARWGYGVRSAFEDRVEVEELTDGKPPELP